MIQLFSGSVRVCARGSQVRDDQGFGLSIVRVIGCGTGRGDGSFFCIASGVFDGQFDANYVSR